MAVKKQAVNHLSNGFYITPKITHQVMTYQDWQETALYTQCKIISQGETWNLRAKHLGGGMYEVSAYPNYWVDGKPPKKTSASK